MHQLTVRLKPGQDFRQEIEKIAEEHKINAGCIVNVVGSLSKATLRMAGAKETKVWEDEFEIVSGTGTVSKNTSHVHISISNPNGTVYGGHLKEGCIVRTTVELAILIFDDVIYDVAPELLK